MAANGLGLGEEGELKAQMLNKPQMLIELQMLNLAPKFNRITNVQFSTSAPLATNPCWWQAFLVSQVSNY